jgi:erythromycin esterase-like protein
MWRNTDIVDFIGWLRHHNETRPDAERVGFYGLDLYSLRASIEAVLAYLDTVDPAAVARALVAMPRSLWAGSQAYGYAVTTGMSSSCEDDVEAQLVELRRQAAEYAARDGRVDPDASFSAGQNARLIANAEAGRCGRGHRTVACSNVRADPVLDLPRCCIEPEQAHRRAARADGGRTQTDRTGWAH